jgi:hypothetical protein
MNRHHLRAAFVAVAFVLATPLASAQTQDPTAAAAQADIAAGRALRDQKDLAGARLRFQSAFDASHRAVAGYELALTLRLLGDLNGAYDICRQVLELEPVEPDELAAQRAAGQLLAEVDPLIPMVLFDIAPVVADVTRVSIDGVDVPQAEWGEPQPVNPGKHVVLVYLRDGSALKKGFAISERARAKLTFKVPRAEADAPPADPDELPKRTGPCPAGSHPDAQDYCVKPVSYGWQIVVVDGLSVGAFVIGGAAQSAVPVAAGFLGYQLASPIVHWSHRRVGRGFASFGLRVAPSLAVLGLLATETVENPSDGTVFAMFTAGMGAGFLLDYFIVPHDDVEKVAGPKASTLRPTLSIAPIRGGVAGSVVFQF